MVYIPGVWVPALSPRVLLCLSFRQRPLWGGIIASGWALQTYVGLPARDRGWYSVRGVPVWQAPLAARLCARVRQGVPAGCLPSSERLCNGFPGEGPLLVTLSRPVGAHLTSNCVGFVFVLFCHCDFCLPAAPSRKCPHVCLLHEWAFGRGGLEGSV